MGKAQKLKEQRKVERKEREERRYNRKKILSRGIIGVAFAAIILGGIFLGGTYAKNNWFNSRPAKVAEKSSQERKQYTKAPDMKIDVNKTYTAKFETAKGNFEVGLDVKDAPRTVNNFVFLANEKFYDGLTFHRIIKDFMIQGGDPKGDGSGGPGYKFADEKVVGDYTPGTIAMANSGANTNGSQFFIMTGDYSNGKLSKNYVIFGHVSSGMDVITKIANEKVKDNGQGEQSKPLESVVINKITIEEK